MRRVRRPGRTAGRRPTPSSRSASLLLCLSPRRLTRADTTTASARRAASTSFLDRAVDLVERAPIVPSCAACAVPDAPPSADRRSSRSASLLLCLSPRRLTRADTTTASARRAASTSFLDRAVDLVERAPIVSSCAACAVPDAPPSADRRHPHVQLRCCSAYRRAGSLEPTRRRRARAEPRARRSLIAPSTSSSARRSCRRAPRAPFRTHRRAPTDATSRSASLLLCLSPRRLTRADTTTASARRAASTSFLDRAVDLVERAPIVSSCAACAVPDAPPSADRRHSRSASLLLCLSPRRLTRADTTTASARRAASTSFLDRAVDLVERAPIVSSCAACAVPDAPPSADRRHHVQLRCCSAYRRAGSLEPTRRRRARAEPRARRSLIAPSTSSSARRSCRRAPRAPFRTHRRAPTDAHHVQLRCCSAYRRAGSLEPTRRRRARAEPRARRSLIAPSTSSSARRSCRRAPRAPFRTHRRAPTDAITFSFVAALPIAAPAHSSRHDDGERAPSREHVVP